MVEYQPFDGGFSREKETPSFFSDWMSTSNFLFLKHPQIKELSSMNDPQNEDGWTLDAKDSSVIAVDQMTIFVAKFL
jgi:hypothetical protein